MSRFLLVIFAIAFASAARRKKEDNCYPVPKMCKSENYTEMRLPNMFNHSRAKDVKRDIGIWQPLLQSPVCNSGGQLRYFLCFMYAPLCVLDNHEGVKPCRSLCETVRDSCDPIMRQFSNYSWPSFFNCDQPRRFPVATPMCINPEMLGLLCSCNESYTKQTLKTMICKSDFVFSGWVRKIETNYRIKVEMSRSFFQRPSVLSRRIVQNRKIPLNLQLNGNHCRCNKLRVKKKGKKGGRYLIIGNKVGKKMNVLALKRMEDRHEIAKMVKEC